MLRKNAIAVKSIAVLLIFVFSFSEIGHASALDVNAILRSPAAAQEKLLQDPSLFQAPLEFSRLREIHRGNKETLILHVQDAHSNFSAQDNLSKTLDEIMSRYRVSLVLVEGGSQDDTLTPIKNIAPPAVWKQVGRKFLMEGKIAGEEYLNLTSDHPMKIMGIENQELYEKSVQSYAALTNRRAEILDYLKSIQSSLEKIKSRLYPQELLDYESVPGERGTAPSGSAERFDRFFDLIQKNNIDLKAFPATQQLLEIKTREKLIDFNAANLEQAALLTELKKGDEGFLREQLKKYNQTKNSPAAQFSFFQNLLNIAKEKKVSLEKYPNFLRYVQHLREFSGLNLDIVLDQIQRAEDVAYQAIILKRSVPEGSLPAGRQETPYGTVRGIAKDVLLTRAVDRYVALLVTAYSIQMSTKDFSFFKANEPDFATEAYLAWVNRKLMELGYPEDIIPAKNILEGGKQALEAFYESVGQRDFAFIENAKKAIKVDGEKARVVVLITGGYHTPHLKELFRKEGWSYAVITPLVTGATDQKKYEDVLLEKIRITKKTVSSNPENLLMVEKKTEGARAEALLQSLRLSEVVSTAARLAGTEDQVSKLLAATELSNLTSGVGESLAAEHPGGVIGAPNTKADISAARLAAPAAIPSLRAGKLKKADADYKELLARQIHSAMTSDPSWAHHFDAPQKRESFALSLANNRVRLTEDGRQYWISEGLIESHELADNLRPAGASMEANILLKVWKGIWNSLDPAIPPQNKYLTQLKESATPAQQLILFQKAYQQLKDSVNPIDARESQKLQPQLLTSSFKFSESPALMASLIPVLDIFRNHNIDITTSQTDLKKQFLIAVYNPAMSGAPGAQAVQDILQAFKSEGIVFTNLSEELQKQFLIAVYKPAMSGAPGAQAVQDILQAFKSEGIVFTNLSEELQKQFLIAVYKPAMSGTPGAHALGNLLTLLKKEYSNYSASQPHLLPLFWRILVLKMKKTDILQEVMEPLNQAPETEIIIEQIKSKLDQKITQKHLRQKITEEDARAIAGARLASDGEGDTEGWDADYREYKKIETEAMEIENLIKTGQIKKAVQRALLFDVENGDPEKSPFSILRLQYVGLSDTRILDEDLPLYEKAYGLAITDTEVRFYKKGIVAMRRGETNLSDAQRRALRIKVLRGLKYFINFYDLLPADYQDLMDRIDYLTIGPTIMDSVETWEMLPRLVNIMRALVLTLRNEIKKGRKGGARLAVPGDPGENSVNSLMTRSAQEITPLLQDRIRRKIAEIGGSRPVYVFITGDAGVGKSSYASYLKTQDPRISVIHLDQVLEDIDPRTSLYSSALPEDAVISGIENLIRFERACEPAPSVILIEGYRMPYYQPFLTQKKIQPDINVLMTADEKTRALNIQSRTKGGSLDSKQRYNLENYDFVIDNSGGKRLPVSPGARLAETQELNEADSSKEMGRETFQKLFAPFATTDSILTLLNEVGIFPETPVLTPDGDEEAYLEFDLAPKGGKFFGQLAAQELFLGNPHASLAEELKKSPENLIDGKAKILAHRQNGYFYPYGIIFFIKGAPVLLDIRDMYVSSVMPPAAYRELHALCLLRAKGHIARHKYRGFMGEYFFGTFVMKRMVRVPENPIVTTTEAMGHKVVTENPWRDYLDPSISSEQRDSKTHLTLLAIERVVGGISIPLTMSPADRFSADWQANLKNYIEVHPVSGQKVFVVGPGSGVDVVDLLKAGATTVYAYDLFETNEIFTKINVHLAKDLGWLDRSCEAVVKTMDGFEDIPTVDTGFFNTTGIDLTNADHSGIGSQSKMMTYDQFKVFFALVAKFLKSAPRGQRRFVLRLDPNTPGDAQEKLITVDAHFERIKKYIVDVFPDFQFLWREGSFYEVEQKNISLEEARRIFGDIMANPMLVRFFNCLGNFEEYPAIRRDISSERKRGWLPFTLDEKGKRFFFEYLKPEIIDGVVRDGRKLGLLNGPEDDLIYQTIFPAAYVLTQADGGRNIPYAVLIYTVVGPMYLDLTELYSSQRSDPAKIARQHGLVGSWVTGLLGSMYTEDKPPTWKRSHGHFVLRRWTRVPENARTVTLTTPIVTKSYQNPWFKMTDSLEIFPSDKRDPKKYITLFAVERVDEEGRLRPTAFSPDDIHSVDWQDFLIKLMDRDAMIKVDVPAGPSGEVRELHMYAGHNIGLMGAGNFSDALILGRYGIPLISSTEKNIGYIPIEEINAIFAKLSGQVPDQTRFIIEHKSGLPTDTSPLKHLMMNTPGVMMDDDPLLKEFQMGSGIVLDAVMMKWSEFQSLFAGIAGFLEPSATQPIKTTVMRLEVQGMQGERADTPGVTSGRIEKFQSRYPALELQGIEGQFYVIRSKSTEPSAARLAAVRNTLFSQLREILPELKEPEKLIVGIESYIAANPNQVSILSLNPKIFVDLLPEDKKPGDIPWRVFYLSTDPGNQNGFESLVTIYGEDDLPDMVMADGHVDYFPARDKPHLKLLRSELAHSPLLARTADDSRRGSSFMDGAAIQLIARPGADKNQVLRQWAAALTQRGILGEHLAVGPGQGLDTRDMDRILHAVKLAGSAKKALSHPVVGVSKMNGGISRYMASIGDGVAAALVFLARSSYLRGEGRPFSPGKQIRVAFFGYTAKSIAVTTSLMDTHASDTGIIIHGISGNGALLTSQQKVPWSILRRVNARLLRGEPMWEIFKEKKIPDDISVRIEGAKDASALPHEFDGANVLMLDCAPRGFDMKLATSFRGEVVMETSPNAATPEAIAYMKDPKNKIIFIPYSTVNIARATLARQEILNAELGIKAEQVGPSQLSTRITERTMSNLLEVFERLEDLEGPWLFAETVEKLNQEEFEHIRYLMHGPLPDRMKNRYDYLVHTKKINPHLARKMVIFEYVTGEYYLEPKNFMKLKKDLSSRDPITRRVAAYRLGSIPADLLSPERNDEIVSCLIPPLTNSAEYYRVRANAARALGRLGGAKALQKLKDVYCDPSLAEPVVREWVEWGLRENNVNFTADIELLKSGIEQKELEADMALGRAEAMGSISGVQDILIEAGRMEFKLASMCVFDGVEPRETLILFMNAAHHLQQSTLEGGLLPITTQRNIALVYRRLAQEARMKKDAKNTLFCEGKAREALLSLLVPGESPYFTEGALIGTRKITLYMYFELLGMMHDRAMSLAAAVDECLLEYKDPANFANRMTPRDALKNIQLRFLKIKGLTRDYEVNASYMENLVILMADAQRNKQDKAAKKGELLGKNLLKSQVKAGGARLATPVILKAENLAADFEPSAFFVSPGKTILEMGVSNGEVLLEDAAKKPENNYIGIDLSGSLKLTEESGAINVRWVEGDARLVLNKIKPHSIDEIRYVFPNPSPDENQTVLASEADVTLILRALKPGGKVMILTEFNYYAQNLDGYFKAAAEKNGAQYSFDLINASKAEGLLGFSIEKSELLNEVRGYLYDENRPGNEVFILRYEMPTGSAGFFELDEKTISALGAKSPRVPTAARLSVENIPALKNLLLQPDWMRQMEPLGEGAFYTAHKTALMLGRAVKVPRQKSKIPTESLAPPLPSTDEQWDILQRLWLERVGAESEVVWTLVRRENGEIAYENVIIQETAFFLEKAYNNITDRGQKARMTRLLRDRQLAHHKRLMRHGFLDTDFISVSNIAVVKRDERRVFVTVDVSHVIDFSKIPDVKAFLSERGESRLSWAEYYLRNIFFTGYGKQGELEAPSPGYSEFIKALFEKDSISPEDIIRTHGIFVAAQNAASREKSAILRNQAYLKVLREKDSAHFLDRLTALLSIPAYKPGPAARLASRFGFVAGSEDLLEGKMREIWAEDAYSSEENTQKLITALFEQAPHLLEIRNDVKRIVYPAAFQDEKTILALLRIFPSVTEVYLIDPVYESKPVSLYAPTWKDWWGIRMKSLSEIRKFSLSQIKIIVIAKNIEDVTVEDVPALKPGELSLVIDKHPGHDGLLRKNPRYREKLLEFGGVGSLVFGLPPFNSSLPRALRWNRAPLARVDLPYMYRYSMEKQQWAISVLSPEDYQNQSAVGPVLGERGARLADSFGAPPAARFTAGEILSTANVRALKRFAASAFSENTQQEFDLQLRRRGFAAARFSLVPGPEGAGMALMMPNVSSAPIFTMSMKEARQRQARYRAAQAAKAAHRHLIDQAVQSFTQKEISTSQAFSEFIAKLTQVRRVQAVIDLSGYSELSREDLIGQIIKLREQIENMPAKKLEFAIRWEGEKEVGGIPSKTLAGEGIITILLGHTSQALVTAAGGKSILMTPDSKSVSLMSQIEAFNYAADLREMIIASLSDGDVALGALGRVFGSHVQTEDMVLVRHVPAGVLLSLYEQRRLLERALKAIPLDLFKEYLLARSVATAA